MIGAIGKTIDEIDVDDIRLYIALRQKNDKISKVTANNELLVLRSFFQTLFVEELITKNPMMKIDTIKNNPSKKKAFTEMEVEQIRSCITNTRDKAAVEVLLSTGCRVSELVGIKITDIKSDELIVHGKGEKDRTVFLNAKAQIAVANHLAERKDSNPHLFCGGYSMQEAKREK